MEKSYEFRKLEAGDIMPVVKILKKAGVKEIIELAKPNLGAFFKEEISDEEAGERGIEIITGIVTVIFDKFETIEDDVFKFLGNVTNLGDKVRKLPLDEFADLLEEFAQKDEMAGFVKRVSRLLKLGQ